MLTPQHLFVLKLLTTFYLKSDILGTTDLTFSSRSIQRRMLRAPKVRKSDFGQSFSNNDPRFFKRLTFEVKLPVNITTSVNSFKMCYLSISDCNCWFYV